MEKVYTIITIVAVTAIIAIGVSGYTGFSLGQRDKISQVVMGNGEGSGFGFQQVIWDNPEKPMSSWPLEESEIPRTAIRIEITQDGFAPDTFKTKAGEEIVVAVKNIDEWNHSFNFRDDNLTDVAISLNPGETRAITFYVPKQKGEYEFYCSMPGHYYAGEKGKMIVE